MDRPDLSLEEIVEILFADQPWHPLHVQGSLEEDEDDVDAQLWRSLNKELAGVCAERLLNPTWSGFLLDHGTVRERLIQVARRFGGLGIPELALTSPSIEQASADWLVAIGPIDLLETCESRWERLRAIAAVAQMYQARSLPDFVRAGVGSNMILRLSTSPEAFRAHQQERIDLKQPGVVEVHLNRLRELVRAQTSTRHFKPRDFPLGQEFWKMRAWWMYWVEVQIDRVWPGCALGSTQAPTTDA